MNYQITRNNEHNSSESYTMTREEKINALDRIDRATIADALESSCIDLLHDIQRERDDTIKQALKSAYERIDALRELFDVSLGR